MQKSKIKYEKEDYSGRVPALEVIGCLINDPTLVHKY